MDRVQPQAIPRMKLTLQTLALIIVAVALMLAALMNPTTRVTVWVVNSVLLSLVLASCFAIGTHQPTRSFWLGCSVTCLSTLLIHQLGQQSIITTPLFPSSLVSLMEDLLPPVPPLRGEPGTTLYLRADSRFIFRSGTRVDSNPQMPILYYNFGKDRTAKEVGFLSLDDIHKPGIADKIGPFHNLRHVDDLPSEVHRSTICPYVLAVFMGLLGGLLAYIIRRLSDRKAAHPESSTP